MDYKKKVSLITCNSLLFTGNVYCLTLIIDGKEKVLEYGDTVSFIKVVNDNNKLLELLQKNGHITNASDYEIIDKDCRGPVFVSLTVKKKRNK